MTNLIQEIDKSLHFRLPDDRIVPAVTIGNFFSGNHSLFLVFSNSDPVLQKI